MNVFEAGVLPSIPLGAIIGGNVLVYKTCVKFFLAKMTI